MTESQDPTNYARNGSTAMSADQERTWATVSHAVAGAAMILSAGTLGFVAALVIYLVYKDKGPFVRQHAADAVNIQLNALLWFIVGGILVLILVGFAVLAVVPIVATVLHVIGAIKAYNGEVHWSPLTIRFVS
jgi:uncharacterized Tic20 family protein